MTAFVVAFSLIVQLFAAATPPSLAAPAFAGADDAAIAAELKAFFGDMAQLCAHVNDDKGSPASMRRAAIAAINARSAASPLRPWRLSRQTCRPCRSGSTATRMRSARRPAATFFLAYPAQPNPARAPPLAV